MMHEQVYTRLGVGSFGVGVIAIVDIPAGTKLFQNDGFDSSAPEVQIEPEEIENLPVAIKKLYTDFCPMKDGKYVSWKGMNFNRLTPGWYINHSKTPNCGCSDDYDFFTLIDINAGDELTVDYDSYDEVGLGLE